MQPYYSAFQPVSSTDKKHLLPEAIPLSKQPSAPTDTAILCIHGFTGTPYEVAPAVEALPQIGVATYAPLLPGHGYQERPEQIKAFANLSEDNLLNAVRQEIAQAKQRYRYVSMIGFSMGGAIALLMAAEGHLDRCAVISPALRLPKKAELLIPLLSWLPFTLDAPIQNPSICLATTSITLTPSVPFGKSVAMLNNSSPTFAVLSSAFTARMILLFPLSFFR